MTTFRRDKLRRLVEAGRVETVGTYQFDDMMGERRTDKPMPVAMWLDNWQDRKEGTCYLRRSDFTTKSGCCYVREGADIVTLIVHSNSSYDLRIKPVETASPSHGSIPASWLAFTWSAEAQLALLKQVNAAGISHDDLAGVRKVWQAMTPAD